MLCDWFTSDKIHHCTASAVLGEIQLLYSKCVISQDVCVLHVYLTCLADISKGLLCIVQSWFSITKLNYVQTQLSIDFLLVFFDFERFYNGISRKDDSDIGLFWCQSQKLSYQVLFERTQKTWGWAGPSSVKGGFKIILEGGID